MRRETTLLQLLVGALALAAGAAAFSGALLSLVDGRGRAAALYAAGGTCLALWAAIHVKDAAG